MTLTGAIVLFATLWFLIFFMVLPVRMVTQQDQGDVTPGTPQGAPAGYVVGRKAKITTAITIVVWAILSGIIMSEVITIEDIDFMGVLKDSPQP